MSRQDMVVGCNVTRADQRQRLVKEAKAARELHAARPWDDYARETLVQTEHALARHDAWTKELRQAYRCTDCGAHLVVTEEGPTVRACPICHLGHDPADAPPDMDREDEGYARARARGWAD